MDKIEMVIDFDTNGFLTTIYNEELNLSELGNSFIRRASHVEPINNNQWEADMKPMNGPTLGPFTSRSAALSAEKEWLNEYLLSS